MWQQFPSSQNPLPSSQGQCSCLTPIRLCTWSAAIYSIAQGCQNPGKYFIITDTCSLLQAWIWFAFPSLCSWSLHKLSLLLNCRKINLNRISSQNLISGCLCQVGCSSFPVVPSFPGALVLVLFLGWSPHAGISADLSCTGNQVWLPWAGTAEGFDGISCSRFSWEQLCPRAISTFSLLVQQISHSVWVDNEYLHDAFYFLLNMKDPWLKTQCPGNWGCSIPSEQNILLALDFSDCRI